MFSPSALGQSKALLCSMVFLRAENLRGRWPLLLVLIILLTAGLVSQSHAQVTRSFTEPAEQSQVAAAEPGVIARLLVREGESVSIGQPLAELDNQVLERSLEIARLRAASDAKVRAAEATLKIRQRKYENLQPLLEVGHANPAEVEQAKAEYDNSFAEYELACQDADEYRLEVARIEAQINHRIINSPIDGLVTDIHRQPGEYISSTEPVFATVVKIDQLRARFYLLSGTASALSHGQPVSLRLDGQPANTVTGHIDYVSPVTDPDSGTVRVDVLIDNADKRLRSGTPCEWIGATTSQPRRQP
ncbi:MAG: efflux RND transporter periplasmic adaptor subunit [Pirellulaceae bacterium]